MTAYKFTWRMDFFLSKFISAAHNHRTDEYDDNSENRARVLGEILDKIRDAVGRDFCVIAKINGDDFTDGGLNILLEIIRKKS